MRHKSRGLQASRNHKNPLKYSEHGCGITTKIRKDCNVTMSKVYSLKTVQNLPVSLEKAWDFFSRPDNLKEITPSNLGFNIISRHQGDRMYAGQIIEYKVSPLLGIPLYWMTEITQVENLKYFIDEQRYGPYSLWHHQHHFKAIEGGVEMTDIVHYKVPFWFLGDIANVILVKSELRKIFDFRFRKAEEVLGKWPGQQATVEFY
jgi:ligand-binding SRPBCC domain-containing protein